MLTSSFRYTITTSPAAHRTISIYMEHVSNPGGRVVDCLTHSITISRDQSTALIRLESSDGAMAQEEVLLGPSMVVCIDFLPIVFNTVQAMYAIGSDRVAVLMQPYSAKIDWPERPMVRLQHGMFEDVVCGRGTIEASQDEPSLDAFHGALARLFEPGKWVRMGSDAILPFRADAEKHYY